MFQKHFMKQSIKNFVDEIDFSAELQKIVHLLFIAGEDYELSEREKVMLEGNDQNFDHKNVKDFDPGV
jgi:hypothetical protein